MKERPISRLLLEERRRKILERLNEMERVTVEDMSTYFGISAVTIRSDLDALADAGALLRTHGGAIKRLNPLHDYPLNVREGVHRNEKVRIGQAAARLIQDGQTIILDSGTTTVEIARQIKFLNLKSLNIITNALNIAMELSSLPNVQLILIGGMLRPLSYALVGPQAEQAMRELTADHLFLGAYAMDFEVGLTTPDLLEAKLDNLMLQVSREVTAVVDSSKFGQRSLSLVARPECLHRLITDTKADPQVVAQLQSRNIKVVLA
jgi:DeoR family transcriptional regulator, aga operon transcriptional repressor